MGDCEAFALSSFKIDKLFVLYMYIAPVHLGIVPRFTRMVVFSIAHPPPQSSYSIHDTRPPAS